MTKRIYSLILCIMLVLSVCVLVGCQDKTVIKTDTTITITNDISKVYDGTKVSTPTYTTESTGTISVLYKATSDSDITYTSTAPTNVGSYTVKVVVAETDTYNSASDTKTFSITKATPTYQGATTFGTIGTGNTLASIDVSSYGLEWSDSSAVVNETGTYKAIYTPTDTTNYTTLEVDITVNVVTNLVTKPTLTKSFDLDGTTKTITTSDIVGYDADTMTIASASVFSAKSAGVYSVIISIKDKVNYAWSDYSQDDITLTWTIMPPIQYVSGTADCYTLTTVDDEFTITFGEISAKTEYSISGTIEGNIVIDVGDDYKFVLDLNGVTISSSKNSPIVILSGDKVTIKAVSGTTSNILDSRDAVTDDEDYSAAIYSKVDTVLGGEGTLNVTSTNNNGIHTKDDLDVEDLTLNVSCIDNALKGNDSVTISSGTITLIARQGDCIKTSNSDVSSKGNQRGIISITGGTITLYSACDGIDASYDVDIGGSSVVNIYTDTYSDYSEEVTATTEGTYYIRSTSSAYKYSIKYYNSDTDYVWANATYYTAVQSMGRGPGSSSTYYYYQVTKYSAYSYFKVYMYTSSTTQGQDTTYVAVSSAKALNNSYDTVVVSKSSSTLSISWSNYTTSTSGGMGPGGQGGGMDEGNTDNGDYSTKGIKADNEIHIEGGTIYIQAYDDAIHTNNDVVLGDEDDETDDYYGSGDITISGGTLTLYSNDDGIHADGTLNITGGTIGITNSYEGIEGTQIVVSGGYTSIVSKDDGANATTTEGQGIVISGGTLYVYAGGDGLDSNSQTSYQGIVFNGGHTVVISTSGGNSTIDTERGYKYTSGYVVAIGISGGMTNEPTECSNFSSVGKSTTLSLTKSNYLVVSNIATIKMPLTMNSFIVVLGSTSCTISSSTTTSSTLDANGVCWY